MVLADRIGFAGAFIVSPIVVGIIGIATERLLFRRFYRSDPILSLLLTFGLAMKVPQHWPEGPTLPTMYFATVD